MALAPRIEMRQGQSLVMTPQLQQAIKLLQLSHLDLAAYVEGELERNPLLEREEDATGREAERADGREAGHPDGRDTERADGGADDAPPPDGADAFASAGEVDASPDDLFPEASEPPGGLSGLGVSHISTAGASSARDGGGDFDEMATLDRAPTLAEHLAQQLMMMPLEPAERLIGRQLIDAIDEAGYLTEDIGAIAERLQAEPRDVEAVLARMQGCEPTGVFARSLRECLALQLADRGELTARMQAFLDNLPLIARHDTAGLMRACQASREDIAEMAVRLRRLNPKPGLGFGDEPVQPVVPDVLVRTAPDGSWIVELNADTLPRVLVDQTYYATVARGARGAEEKSYLSECLANANWLVKSLDQRARTILKVAREIVRQQDAFLIHGVRHLRPLNLKTVASAIEMHESTVSRVTSNKYMLTPRGIFELKYFFTSAITAADGAESVSAEAVRHRIREMVDNETAADILSDDRLVELLHDAGIEIARRTVAKYREGMNIPSSVQRRRMKRAYA